MTKIKSFAYQVLTLLIWNLASLTSPIQSAVETITTPDGAKLRAAHWKAASPSTQPVTVVLLQGRSSYIEKFEETVKDLRKQGYDVWTFDWRGSGGSSRLISNSQKVYIDSYDTYLQDLDYMIQKVVKPQSSKPLVLFSISMGGHLALRYAQEKPDQIAGVFAVVPMINVITDPYPVWMARWMVSSATWMGLGQSYVVGYGDYQVNQPINPEKVGTTDLNRYQRQLDLNAANMSFVTAGPTYRWVYESFKSIDVLKRPSSINKIKVPVMMIKAEHDFVVDASKDEAFCAQIPHCKIKTYAGARHNIFIEKDEIRTHLFEDFNEFVKLLK